jgi:hypothetical protein
MKQSGSHSQYTFPDKIPKLIDEKLGMAEGFIDTQKKITFAENIFDLMKLLLIFERKGECKNNFSGKQIKKKIDQVNFGKTSQIFYNGGYLLSTYAIEHDNKYCTNEEYLFEYPENFDPKTQTIEQLPSLIGLKSKDELSGNEPLKRIAQAVPEKVAYAGEDPTWLTEVALLKYEKNGVFYPYFNTIGDIKNSEHWTKDVPLNYLDNTFNTVWRYFEHYVNEFRADAWIMARQMTIMDFTEE